jgi:hypothetical protein
MCSPLLPSRRRLPVATCLLALLLAALALGASAQELKIALSGANEIPPVTTSATGTATISVAADRTLAVSVTIAGMNVLMAHIHEAPAGANGPIVVPLVKVGDNAWSVPPGTQLTEAQYEAYKAGRLYFNIHSETWRSGEIRGQIRP